MEQTTVKISPVNIEDRKKLGIRAGDTVRVWVRVVEKGKTRLQAFEGLVLARKHGDEAGASFTVRKVASGIGVERTFPLFSPVIDKIEIIKRARVRRSKLYFIREKVAREIRRQMRKMKMMDLSTQSEAEAENERVKQAEEEAQKKEQEAVVSKDENKESEEKEEIIDKQEEKEELIEDVNTKVIEDIVKEEK